MSNQGKLKISTTVHTDTRNVSENGMTEVVVTKIITDHYADGSSSTRRETQSTREEEITVGGTGINRPEYPIRNSLITGQNRTSYDANTTRTSYDATNNRTSFGNPTYNNRTSVGNGQRTSLDTRNNRNSYGKNQVGYAIDPNSPQSDLRTDERFIEEALLCHNKYRIKHSVPQLSLSYDLARSAQNWADQLAQKGAMENSHYGYGENIYWSSAPGGAMKGDVPVEYWYHEIVHFDWVKMDFQKTTGSFTQVIWKNTTQFGIAKATGAKGTFVVAFYVPPGNVLGQFRDNVYPAQS